MGVGNPWDVKPMEIHQPIKPIIDLKKSEYLSGKYLLLKDSKGEVKRPGALHLKGFPTIFPPGCQPDPLV